MLSFLVSKNTKILTKERFDIPWLGSAQAYNFCVPTEMIDYVEDPHFFERYDRNERCQIYIGGDLDDYTWIPYFEKVFALYIEDAEELEDLSFVRELKHLQMLSIKHSRVSDLTPVVDRMTESLRFLEENRDRPDRDIMDYWCLEDVAIQNSRISDLKPLQDYPGELTNLILRGNQIRDISPIVRLWVWDMDLSYNQIDDVRDLILTRWERKRLKQSWKEGHLLCLQGNPLQTNFSESELDMLHKDWRVTMPAQFNEDGREPSEMTQPNYYMRVRKQRKDVMDWYRTYGIGDGPKPPKEAFDEGWDYPPTMQEPMNLLDDSHH